MIFSRQSVTPALRSELAEHGQELPGGEVASFRRKIGERGWFGLNWSPEYGGLGLGATYQHLLMREFEYWGVPGPDLTVTSVAPMIMRHGTEQNKLEFLPPIARGELTCAVGYSEPEAGTDSGELCALVRCKTVTSGSSPDPRSGTAAHSERPMNGSVSAPIPMRHGTGEFR